MNFFRSTLIAGTIIACAGALAGNIVTRGRYFMPSTR
jgi:hypothetical protein